VEKVALRAPRNMMACPDCDLLLEPVPVQDNQSGFCPRCGGRLFRIRRHAVQKTMALSLAGLLLYLPANLQPLMTFEILGTTSGASVFTSTLAMFAQHQYLVGTVVVLTALVFPLLVLTLLFWVSVGVSRGWKSSALRCGFRWLHHLQEWAMTDVYLIGILITIIKMGHQAEIELDTGFYCFAGLVLVTIGGLAAIDHHGFWESLRSKDGPYPLSGHQAGGEGTTAGDAGLVHCLTCNTLVPEAKVGAAGRCPTCHAHLAFRKQGSVNRTWALLTTAVLLTVPANILPIMEVEYFGSLERKTILDGILYFFQEGSYGIGIIILTASILVPLFKIMGLVLILLSIHFRLEGWLRHKQMMLRFISFIGRWSMLDIFVISLLCALVRFDYLSTVNAAPAAFYFTGVVLSTMFAAISFDSRLLWDAVSLETGEPAHGTACPA